MNIAHCIHGLGLGGAQQIIKYIVRGSDHDTFRHHVYSPEDGVLRQQIEAAGATVRIIERRLPKFDPSWVAALARAMRRDAIDVVHTHLIGDTLHGLLAARATGAVPVVITLHNGADAHTRLQRWGYRWVLARSARNIACTPSVARSWSNIGAAIDVISNAIDTPPAACAGGVASAEVKASLGIDPSTRVVGGVGRFVEQKAFHNLISAFARLCRASGRDVRLLLVGDGPLRAQLQRHAEREHVADRVVFTGFRPDVTHLLQAFDVLVFSSGYEGLPIALLEGMAAARCIVATNAPGILDGVTADRDALIVPAGDVGWLAAALARALADPFLRRRLGDAARRRFVDEFTADRMVARYEAVYRDVSAGLRGTDNDDWSDARAAERGAPLARTPHRRTL